MSMTETEQIGFVENIGLTYPLANPSVASTTLNRTTGWEDGCTDAVTTRGTLKVQVLQITQ